jgi:hypothetical protein
MPYGYYGAAVAPDIPVDVTPLSGLTDSDLEVGLRVGKVVFGSNPADANTVANHTVVEVLGHTLELINDSTGVNTPGNVAVRSGEIHPAAKATGQLHCTSSGPYFPVTITFSSTPPYGVIIGDSDPETYGYDFVQSSNYSWSNQGDCANSLASILSPYFDCTVTEDTSGYPSYWWVNLTAKTAGAAANCGLSVSDSNMATVVSGMSGGEDEHLAPDSNTTVAMAFATVISSITPEFIESAIDPAHTNEVILISLE